MMGPGRPAWVVLAVVVPITIGAAALLHSVIETPLIARRWQPVRLAQGTFALTAVTVLALLLAYPTSTPTGEVAADLRAVADPVTTEDRASAGESNEGPVSPPAEVAGATKSPTSTTTTTICIPQLPPTQSQTTLSPSRGGFDPDTVAQIGDPGWPTCDSQIDVMVVGDSTGRGMANGLVALQDPNLRVWDRTILGCSLGDEDCGDWRQEWAPHVDGIDPDVVLLYTNPVVDLKGIDDAEFLSAEGAAQRESILREAAQLLSRNGAALVFVAPPVPRSPEGLFFCNGRRSNTQCDADWVDAWIASVEKVALESGSPVLNVRAYVDELPDDRAARPDGMHFAGDALKEAAHWSRSIYALSVLKQREQQIEDAKEAFSSN